MKLCREMVDAMGGPDSPHYRRFHSLCCEAYNILRKSANLLLNLVHLMAGASITDIAADPQKAMLKLQVRVVWGGPGVGAPPYHLRAHPNQIDV